jgi:Na+/proline symporter
MVVARAVFCLSLAATLFWPLGFVAEWALGTEPPIWPYAISAVLVTGLFAAAAFRRWPGFLTWEAGKALAFWRATVLWTVLAYAGGAVVIGVVAYALFVLKGDASGQMRNEASLAAYILALWFPLWFSPAVGLAVGWLRQAR